MRVVRYTAHAHVSKAFFCFFVTFVCYRRCGIFEDAKRKTSHLGVHLCERRQLSLGHLLLRRLLSVLQKAERVETEDRTKWLRSGAKGSRAGCASNAIVWSAKDKTRMIQAARVRGTNARRPRRTHIAHLFLFELSQPLGLSSPRGCLVRTLVRFFPLRLGLCFAPVSRRRPEGVILRLGLRRARLRSLGALALKLLSSPLPGCPAHLWYASYDAEGASSRRGHESGWTTS